MTIIKSGLIQFLFISTLNFMLALMPTNLPASDKSDTKNPNINSYPIYNQLRSIDISEQAVFVKNFTLSQDVGTFTFKNGTFYFLEPVDEEFIGAVFIGDGEFQITPMDKSDRQFLNHLNGKKMMKDSFSRLVLFFTDKNKTYQQLVSSGSEAIKSIPKTTRAKSFLRKTQKRLRKKLLFSPANMASYILPYNLEIRLLTDITRPENETYFFSFWEGTQYGNTLYIVDPLGAPVVDSVEVMLAILNEKYLGIWVAERLKKFYGKEENTIPLTPTSLIDMQHYDIDVTLKGEKIEAVVKATFKALMDQTKVIPLELFSYLRIKKIYDDKSQPLSFIQEGEKKEDNFAFVLNKGLKKGNIYTITFEYSGIKALDKKGGGNIDLDVRDAWYPFHCFNDQATYNFVFRIPSGFNIVATGYKIKETEENNMRISHWESRIPLKVAGFNYGKFNAITPKNPKSVCVTLESYINKELPDNVTLINMVGGNFNSAQKADVILAEAQLSLNMYTSLYGPLGFHRVALTQQSYWGFGQAWPMLVYMPLVAYFDSSKFNPIDYPGVKEFQRYTCAHEIAHQWFGHTIGFSDYRHNWLSEALAEFSTSLFVLNVYKSKPYMKFWQTHRDMILKKNIKRLIPASIGSMTLGNRLNTARTGRIYIAAIYSKGAFIIHMIRCMMWNRKTKDSLFFNMMKDFVKTYTNKEATTLDFKRMLEKHMIPEMNLDKNGKMDWFFNQWVYGTQIPHYKLKYKIKNGEAGKFIISFSITQSKVSDDFKMRVPIYLVFKNGKKINLTAMILKGNTTVEQEIPLSLPQKPKKLELCAYEDVLCTITNR